ncbi:MAG: T9SS type A sorting domain-containing protein, partial [Bacteroidetes bacterium]|nr:T9SS type A sorting domain-containing protein [Bacteroidota bacterium]
VYLTETDLQGPEAICQNDLVTFEFETCVSPPVSSWEVSDNLEIITSDDFSVTVRSINSSNNTGSITAIYPYQAVQKDVWVGKPGPPSYLNGPELVPSGGLVQYNGGVAQGASSYQWWLPHPFEIRNPFDLFGDHWQVHPSAGRSTQVFTGYAGTDGLVQLIGENECGLGSAAIMEVSHGTGGDGDPPLPVYPYPNSSNEAFKLDFSYYEEGSYGIFIYDQFSNLLYEGESSNIEKTISTSEIANGVYFLHIHLNDEVKQYQLLVSH